MLLDKGFPKPWYDFACESVDSIVCATCYNKYSVTSGSLSSCFFVVWMINIFLLSDPQ